MALTDLLEFFRSLGKIVADSSFRTRTLRHAHLLVDLVVAKTPIGIFGVVRVVGVESFVERVWL